MRFLVCFAVAGFLFCGSLLGQVQKVTPTQKSVPATSQKTVPQGSIQKTPVQGATQKTPTYSAAQKGSGGMWVYVDAATLAQVRELERRQERPVLNSVVIACLKKVLGKKLEELIPNDPGLPIPVPGPGNGGGPLARLQQRRAARVNVQAPFVDVQVQPGAVAVGGSTADFEAAVLPDPPPIR